MMGGKGIPMEGNSLSKGEEAKTKESKSKQTKQHKPASKPEEAYLVLEAASCPLGSVQSWRLEASRGRVRGSPNDGQSSES